MGIVHWRVVAAAGAGLSFGLVAAFALPGLGQQAGATDAAGLQSAIAALTQRVAVLEQARTKPWQAPFEVADPNGQILFSVEAASGGAEVHVKGSGGVIGLTANNETVEVSLAEGAEAAYTTVTVDKVSQSFGKADAPSWQVTASDATNGLMIGKDSAAHLKVAVEDAIADAVIGTADHQMELWGSTSSSGLRGLIGGDSKFHISDSGKPGYALVFGNGEVSSGPSVQLGLHNDGLFGLSLWDGNTPLASFKPGADGSSAALNLYSGGKPMATLGKLEDGSTGLGITADADKVFVGKGANGPELSLSPGGAKLFNVNAASDGSLLRLGPETGKRAEISTKNKGLPLFSATTADGMAQLGWYKEGQDGVTFLRGDKYDAAVVDTPQGGQLYARSPDGTDYVQLGIRKDGTNAILLGHANKDLVTIQPSEQIDAGLITVSDKTGIVERLGLFGEDNGLFMSDPNGLIDLSISSKGGSAAFGTSTGDFAEIDSFNGVGALTLSAAGKPVISLGSTKDKATAALRAFDGTNEAVALGVDGTGNGEFDLFSHGQLGAGMLALNGGGSVFVNNEGKLAASMNSLDVPGQGAFVVRNGSNAATAVLTTGGGNGGYLEMNDPSGTEVARMGFSPNDEGPGFSCVNHKGDVKCLGIGLTGMEGFR
jgi:hypothetical protein